MQSSELLALFTTSDHAEQRRFAALELADVAEMNEEIIEALSSGLCDPDKGVRDVCAFALRNRSDHAADKARFVAPLIAHERIEVRNLAGEVLIKFGAPAADALLPYMTDPDPDVRKFACDIIALLDNTADNVMQTVMLLLDDPDENVCTAAVDALGRLGTDSCVGALIALYKRNEDLGPYIIQSLGQIGGEQAQEFLLELLSSADEFAQISAIDALALCGTNADIARRIMAELPAASEQVQTIMLRTVFGLAYRLNENIELPADLRHIAHRSMNDDDEEIRIAGLFALGSFFRKEDVPALLQFLMHSDEPLQRHVLTVLLTASDASVVDTFIEGFLSLADTELLRIQDLPMLLPDLWAAVAAPMRQQVLESIERGFGSLSEIGRCRLLLVIPALDAGLAARLQALPQNSEQPVSDTADNSGQP